MTPPLWLWSNPRLGTVFREQKQHTALELNKNEIHNQV